MRLHNFSLDGLADFNTDNPIVQDHFKQAHEFWLENFPQLAGFRMDSIKHIDNDYWRKFSEDIWTYKPGVELVGEYFGGGTSAPDAVDFYNTTHFSTFDFDFGGDVRDIYLNGGSFLQLPNLWAKDPQLGDARAMVTFLDNHDVARLRGEGVTEVYMKQLIALWFVARGIPCIYYGMEQDLFTPGDKGDPTNRPRMVSFNTSSPSFKQMQTLIQLRKDNQALRYGQTHVVYQSNDILAFERTFEG